tara:strand:- start:1 stop:315 length:315 start_codon:yes stop_codon:yes gene_type:complete
MYKIKKSTLQQAYKPYDVVSTKDGQVGFIKEVNVNDCQPKVYDQISYSITWLVGTNYNAWWKHEDLLWHSNIFIEIAKASTHPFGRNESNVDDLFQNIIKRKTP